MNDGNDSDIDNDNKNRNTTKGNGSFSSFLAKIESFIDRLVGEVIVKGLPEHKVSSVSDDPLKSQTLYVPKVLCVFE